MSLNKFNKKDDPNAQKKSELTSKLNPILTAKTDPYVDDNELYKNRINRTDKQKHFEFLLENKQRRKPPPDFKSWVGKEMFMEDEAEMYPSHLKKLFNFTKTAKWDHYMLNLLLLLLLLVAAVESELVPPTLRTLYSALAALMFLTQIIPYAGTFYFICNCNDMVRYMASVDFPTWVRFAANL
jgi:hypothetical protein